MSAHKRQLFGSKYRQLPAIFVLLLAGVLIVLAVMNSCKAPPSPSKDIAFTPTVAPTPSTPLDRLLTLVQSSDHCTVPCWRGLEPGTSTKSDFDALVATSPVSRFSDMNCLRGGCTWIDEDAILLSDVSFEDGVITWLKFTPTAVEHPTGTAYFGHLTLDDVVQVMGLPDGYSAEVYRGLQGKTFFGLSLFFGDTGAIVEYLTWEYEPEDSAFQPMCQIAVPPDTTARKITFTSPSIVQAAMNESATGAFVGGALVSGAGVYEEILPWPGFGPIKLTGCSED